MAKRNKNGRYEKSVVNNGKRYRIRAYTREELREKEEQVRDNIKKGYDRIHNPTLNQYYQYFTDVRRSEIKESTIRAQQSQIKSVLEFVREDNKPFGEMHLKDITRRDIESVRLALLEEGKTPQNLNIIFRHLNNVFNTATLDDTIVKNPCRALKPLKRDNTPLVKETKHRALTQTETKMFFETAKERKSYYYNDFLFMLKTGVRVGELTALTRADIDTMQGLIHIHKTVQRNESGTYIVAETTKTKSGKRDIPLTQDVLDIVKEQEQLNVLVFGKPSNVVNVSDIKKNLLFRSAEGMILREYSINREIKRICLASGIEPFTCHAFRNTFATRWIEQRPEDYKILSEILGHSDVAITLNLYTHVMVDKKIDAMNSIKIDVV